MYLSSRSSRLVAAVVALLVAVLLSGCRGSGDDAVSDTSEAESSALPLLPDDFQAVCSGTSVPGATDYDSSATAHKMLYFETYGSDLQDASGELPPAWTATFAEEGDALAVVDSVACGFRTGQKQVKVCDGYEDDGKATGNKVNWHTATYTLTVYAATTGEELGSTTIEATSEDCPTFATFDGTNETIEMYDPVPDAARDRFLKKFVAR